MEKEIAEGNKLIIESPFHATEYEITKSDKMSKLFYTEVLKFHKSYDWLMPVVEKIRSWLDKEMPETDEFLDSFIKANLLLFKLKLSDTSINEVYVAVVDFIKWYNQQPK